MTSIEELQELASPLAAVGCKARITLAEGDGMHRCAVAVDPHGAVVSVRSLTKRGALLAAGAALVVQLQDAAGELPDDC